MSKKILSTNKRYIGAKDIDIFVNAELLGEKNILKPDRADNVFDFEAKFVEERNKSFKFCVYGLVESKWGDSGDLKVDFRIGDSSTNSNNTPSTISNNDVFWLYDKSTNFSATSWSFVTKYLDDVSGELAKNLYGKRKASYFFPFEIDLNTITKKNKSIYFSIVDPIKNLYTQQEIPFLFFDEDGVIVDFGQETAEILDNGDTLEINNNYPFFYDRHWIRREIEPIGPPYVSFVKKEIYIDEGGANPDTQSDKFIDIQVTLSEPSLSGLERVKINVVYGVDENKIQLTDITVPQDISFNFNDLTWDKIGQDPVKTIRIKLNDDFYVEPVERLTLQLTPLIAVLPDPIKPQTITIYIKDNDIPSQVSFISQTTKVFEPRTDINAIIIPIDLQLDKLLKVPNQYCYLFVDENETDCKADFGFQTISGFSGLTHSKKVEFNQNDLLFSESLYLRGTRQNDIPRKIVLKLSGFSSNIILGNYNPNQNTQYTINVDKDLDYNYVTIKIPFDKQNGNGVMRSAFNRTKNPTDYDKYGLQDTPTRLETYPGSINGDVVPNTKLALTNNSTQSIRHLVYENNFKINIQSQAENFVFDGKLYKPSDTLTITVFSGSSTSVSSDEFIFDGTAYYLKLPANTNFLGISNFSFGQIINIDSFWGYFGLYYSITIENLTYNYAFNSNVTTTDGVTKLTTDASTTNLLKNQVYFYNSNYNGPNPLESDFRVSAGNDNNPQVYYMNTALINSFSQIRFFPDLEIVASFTSSTLSYNQNTLYYKGVLILPDEYLFDFFKKTDPNNNTFYYVPKEGLNQSTGSRIILSKGNPLDLNDLIINSSTNNSFNLPVSTLLLNEPFSQYTIPFGVNLGKILVQTGYKVNSFNPGIGPSYSLDSFAAKIGLFSNNYTGFNGEFNNLSRIDNANPNTVNSFIIEIKNTGIIPVEIYGYTVGVNQKLWFSKVPVNINNQIGVVGNVILTNSVNQNVGNYNPFILKTNYEFNQTATGSVFEKFVTAKYEISFKNIKIYNANNTFTNKTVNYTFNLEKRIRTVSPTSVVHLVNKYNDNVLVNTTSGNYGVRTQVCQTTFNFSDARALKRLEVITKKLFQIIGYIASASQDCNIIESSFEYFDDIDNTDPCNANGFMWHEVKAKGSQNN